MWRMCGARSFTPQRHQTDLLRLHANTVTCILSQSVHTYSLPCIDSYSTSIITIYHSLPFLIECLSGAPLLIILRITLTGLNLNLVRRYEHYCRHDDAAATLNPVGNLTLDDQVHGRNWGTSLRRSVLPVPTAVPSVASSIALFSTTCPSRQNIHPKERGGHGQPRIESIHKISFPSVFCSSAKSHMRRQQRTWMCDEELFNEIVKFHGRIAVRWF